MKSNILDSIAKIITILGIVITFFLGIGSNLITNKLGQGWDLEVIVTSIIIGSIAVSVAFAVARTLFQPEVIIGKSGTPKSSVLSLETDLSHNEMETTSSSSSDSQILATRNSIATQTRQFPNRNTRFITIPVDLAAIENLEIEGGPLEHELYEKLEAFDYQYTRLMKSPHQSSGKKSIRPRIIIPSFPILGQATANPRGKALLPMESIQQDIASVVDENMELRIQNHTYAVFLKEGLREINGRNYSWFQVAGDSMNNAEPIPIENEDYVLIQKMDSNPRLYDGKIVLASVRDNNIDPTRLMVKRFVSMIPKQQSGLKVTTPLLISESLSKIKAIQLSEEYQIEGEVVAIAKLINE